MYFYSRNSNVSVEASSFAENRANKVKSQFTLKIK
jgi:hypothetical protein